MFSQLRNLGNGSGLALCLCFWMMPSREAHAHPFAADSKTLADQIKVVSVGPSRAGVTGIAPPSIALRGQEFTVTATDFEFNPSTLNIKVGDSVVFRNINGTHTVTGNGTEPFCGEAPISANSCRVTFNFPGVFPYRCLFHSNGGAVPSGMAGSITVEPADLPNLRPIQPTGWSDALVASTERGSHTTAARFGSDQEIWIHWAMFNSSPSVDIVERFSSELLLDGASVGTWSQEGLTANTSVSVEDINIGKLSPGVHTLRLILDQGDKVAEENEADNLADAHLTISVHPERPQVEASSSVDGSFTEVPAAVIDETANTITLPLPPTTTFWRLRSSIPLRILEMNIQDSSVVLRYRE
jgi:plastocyanin